jgi:hypothetical protein
MNLQKVILSTGQPSMVTADIADGSVLTLTQFESLLLLIPYTGGADGGVEALLEVWSHVPNELVSSDASCVEDDEKEETSADNRKRERSEDTSGIENSQSLVDQATGPGLDELNPLKTLKVIENSQSSVNQTSDSGFIQLSPLKTTQIQSEETLMLLGNSGLAKLYLRVDPGNKRLFSVRRRHLLVMNLH